MVSLRTLASTGEGDIRIACHITSEITTFCSIVRSIHTALAIGLCSIVRSLTRIHCVAVCRAGEAGIFDMTFDKSGSRLITCEADKTIKVYKEDPASTEATHPVKWKPTMMKKARF
eukprot:m.180045 g.180045  ORF g.180045 m.180045 type:complete len:116 (+) comp18408_c0_seq5:178-525(+)